MYNQSWYPYEENSRQALSSSYVRVLHASPDAPAVDIYVNNTLAARNVAYREFTPYLPLVAGLYNITVYAAGTKTNPVISTNVNIPPSSIFTAAATGRLSSIGLTLIPEPPEVIPPGYSLIRLVHLSPGTPSVDLTANGAKLFSDIEYKEISPYVRVRPGRYEFLANTTGTGNVILTVPNIDLGVDKIYTIYLIGLSSGSPGLQVLIPLDGSTYLRA